MAIHAKSTNGRTEWIVDKGRLKEIGPDTYTFTMTALDTQVLKNLLLSGKDEIDKAADKELHAFVRKMGPEDPDNLPYATGIETDE